MKRRFEERIAISVPVRVWGMDANGKPFSQSATTLDITRTGARLGGLNAPLQQGDTIGIQHGTEKARFRVVWAGRPGGSQNGQAGVYCLEQPKYIWGVSLERLTEQAACAAPVAAGAPPSTNPNHYSGFVGPIPDPQPRDDRRGVARHPCNGSAEIVNLKTGFTTWGTITDVSWSGCYVETALPLPTGTRADAALTFLGTVIRCKTEVRASHPTVGMGLIFLQMTVEDRQRLTQVLERLETRASQTAVRPPATPSNAPPASPSPDGNAAALSSNIYKVSAELREVEAKLATGGMKLDPRIIAEFRRTMDQARQTAWAVQQFIETSESTRDSYKLLADMENRRIRYATETVRDLVLDVDSQAIQLDTEGLPELITAIAQLHRRFSFLAQSHRATDEE